MSDPRTRFKVPWDILLIAITSGVVALLLGIIYIVPNLFATFISLGIILVAAAFGVFGYSIQDGELRIIWLGWSKNIPMKEIKSVETKKS